MELSIVSPDLPVVVILGRPNVGKSSLFNRLLQRRQALVDATPGLTRDRLYGEVRWRGTRFRVVDTGGLVSFSGAGKGGLEEAIAAQVARAMEEATLALVVCDTRDGVTPLDRQVADWARRWRKPVMLVANKADTRELSDAAAELSELGLGPPRSISGLHGLGIGELLDDLVSRLCEKGSGTSVQGGLPGEPAGGTLRVVIVGRPNVGKSSLLNRILNEERVLVDTEPGTTRDPVETQFIYRGRRICWVDTAGLRARRTLKSRMDAVARIKALEAISGADVCLGVLEAPLGIVRDDLRLLDHVVTAGKPLCLAVNKWDLLPRSADTRQVAAAIARRAPFLRHAPVLCVSARTGYQVLKAIEQVVDLADRSGRRLEPAQLSELLKAICGDSRTPAGLRSAVLLRLRQVGVRPPTFHLLGRLRKPLRDSDVAFVENLLRKVGGFEGVPIRIRLPARRAR